MRALIVGLLLALSACENPSPVAPPLAAAGEQTCISEQVRVRIDRNQIFWNDEAVDEPELARRSAAHWCGERPYAIMIDQALPNPGDKVAIATSLRVSRLITTKHATLPDTLRQLADGSY